MPRDYRVRESCASAGGCGVDATTSAIVGIMQFARGMGWTTAGEMGRDMEKERGEVRFR